MDPRQAAGAERFAMHAAARSKSGVGGVDQRRRDIADTVSAKVWVEVAVEN